MLVQLCCPSWEGCPLFRTMIFEISSVFVKFLRQVTKYHVDLYDLFSRLHSLVSMREIDKVFRRHGTDDLISVFYYIMNVVFMPIILIIQYFTKNIVTLRMHVAI